jgi:hypothetical protein
MADRVASYKIRSQAQFDALLGAEDWRETKPQILK